MSQETSKWLNNMTLIGFTSKRGDAWHYREDLQGDESNHYDGAIPVEDVTRRLFNWAPVEGTVLTEYVRPEIVDESGVTPAETVRMVDATRKTIIRPAGALGPDDKGAVLYVPKSGFQVHEYNEWLLTNVANLLDDSLNIGSAGLLRGGALAWVQVEMPESIETPEGVTFRPFVSAATSLDGSLSSTYQAGSQLIVCDNTLSASLGETAALRIKIKHSRKSLGRIGEVREALELVHNVADDFAAQVKALCEIDVSDKAWSAFLDAHKPLPKVEEGKSTRGLTIAEKERDALSRLWNHDARVSPWKGTAWGVVQAVNTYTHHEGTVKGGSRVQRNAERSVTGKVDALDGSTLTTLTKVLASV